MWYQHHILLLTTITLESFVKVENWYGLGTTSDQKFYLLIIIMSQLHIKLHMKKIYIESKQNYERLLRRNYEGRDN